MYPKILDLGPVTIHTYGLLLAAAFIAGIWITSRNAKKAGINPDLIWNMGLIVIFSALVGAKILLLFSDFEYYSQNFREIFSLSTLRSTRSVLRRTAAGIGCGRMVSCKEALAGLADGGSCGSRDRAGTGHRSTGMPLGRMLLRQADAHALGNHVYEPIRLQ